ncbi:DUF6903 family protein [Ferdinandcohnia quinoae]|uniref:Uncharacterized protein n=1 Tax=Fredinandcohnia quinoae TaxID=2918902 RepID=A0AAW5DUY8_9BACI|nr:hypothetical protein [Fredinandcohnia sp. SECRCQ15]MCH1624158.1 hypothetical protein [Fredinandcohnia sp. SECRCQ15]
MDRNVFYIIIKLILFIICIALIIIGQSTVGKPNFGIMLIGLAGLLLLLYDYNRKYT